MVCYDLDVTSSSITEFLFLLFTDLSILLIYY